MSWYVCFPEMHLMLLFLNFCSKKRHDYFAYVSYFCDGGPNAGFTTIISSVFELVGICHLWRYWPRKNRFHFIWDDLVPDVYFIHHFQQSWCLDSRIQVHSLKTSVFYLLFFDISCYPWSILSCKHIKQCENTVNCQYFLVLSGIVLFFSGFTHILAYFHFVGPHVGIACSLSCMCCWVFTLSPIWSSPSYMIALRMRYTSLFSVTGHDCVIVVILFGKHLHIRHLELSEMFMLLLTRVHEIYNKLIARL